MFVNSNPDYVAVFSERATSAQAYRGRKGLRFIGFLFIFPKDPGRCGGIARNALNPKH